MRLIHSPGIKWLGLLAATTVLSGCAGTGSESQAGRIRITSEPAGAVAYADDAELGATPLQIVPGNHFRSGFVGLTYRYIGRLSISKAGCETWSTEVNDNILSKDIHARLKCNPDYRPAAAAPPSPAKPAVPIPEPASGDPYIERLERLETLRQKGLISEEEYRQLRARIFEKL
jgi:hypothetical protein